MESQVYEPYWKITLEYSDINGDKFIGTLRIIVDFINKHKRRFYSVKLYEKLQSEVNKAYPKEDMASVRKSINQFVKLGFINFELKSYHEDTINFLNANTNRRRKSIFSKIVYTNSSFNRSVTTDSNKKEINFLIKTLEEIGKLEEDDIIALMRVDTSKYLKGYLTKEELDKEIEESKISKFSDRKYNQISYLRIILDKLDDLKFVRKCLYFEEDALDKFGDYLREKDHRRDYYLYRIYKNQLKEESSEKLGDIKCMLEILNYPTLVASHIKPFILSSKEEAYDPDNGLLLSRNMDGLFDQGYISFNSDGTILLSNELSDELKEYLKNYSLRDVFLTKKRIKYLKYNRKKVFRG